MKCINGLSNFFGLLIFFSIMACSTRHSDLDLPKDLSSSLYNTHIEAVDLSSFQTDFDFCSYVTRESEPSYLGGILRLQIEIGESGTINEMKTLSAFKGSNQLLQCLENRAKTWSFEEKNWNSIQVWTWNFKVSP